MLNRFLFCLFLLPIYTINTMEITPHNPMETLPKDLIVYNISTCLDRLDRNNFRITNKKNSKLILPQAQLNSHYMQACNDNNRNAIIEWRKKGALEPLEEICRMVVNRRDDRNTLAKKLWGHLPIEEQTINGLKYGVIQNNLLFVSWILKTSNPTYWSQAIRDSLALSRMLNHCTINIYLQNYINEKEHAEKQTQSDGQYRYWPKHGPPAP